MMMRYMRLGCRASRTGFTRILEEREGWVYCRSMRSIENDLHEFIFSITRKSCADDVQCANGT